MTASSLKQGTTMEQRGGGTSVEGGLNRRTTEPAYALVVCCPGWPGLLSLTTPPQARLKTPGRIWVGARAGLSSREFLSQPLPTIHSWPAANARNCVQHLQVVERAGEHVGNGCSRSNARVPLGVLRKSCLPRAKAGGSGNGRISQVQVLQRARPSRSPLAVTDSSQVLPLAKALDSLRSAWQPACG